MLWGKTCNGIYQHFLNEENAKSLNVATDHQRIMPKFRNLFFLSLGPLSWTSHLCQSPMRLLLGWSFCSISRWGIMGPAGRWRHNQARLSWWSFLFERVTQCASDRWYPSNSPRIQLPDVVPRILQTYENIPSKTSRGKVLQRSKSVPSLKER